MDNQTKAVFLLENRPLMVAALGSAIRNLFSVDFSQFHSYEEMPKTFPSQSLLFLAVHLLPVDAHIPSKREGVVAVVYGEYFTPNCAPWWIERGARGVWDLRDGLETIQGSLNEAEEKEFKSPTVVRELNGSAHPHGMHLLSKRELQVAKRLVCGNSTRDVAKELGVTEGTVKNQRKSVYRKLGIVRSSQLPLAMGNGFASLKT